MPTHRNITVPFVLAGRAFKAVGFLAHDESRVGGLEALQRVPSVIAGEAEAHMREACEFEKGKQMSQLPQRLQAYVLVTAEPMENAPHLVSAYFFCRGQWIHSWLQAKGVGHIRVLFVCPG